MTGRPAPLRQLQLLLTERCNLACTHCAVPEEDSPALGELCTEEWRCFLQVALGDGVRRIVLSGGEALLRPDCLDIAEHALVAGAEQVVIVTNGTLLPVTVVRRLAALQRAWAGLHIHVSIDGATPATHDLIRGTGSFARTIRGVERLRAAGGVVQGVHTVLHRANVGELHPLVILVSAMGAQTWTVFPVASLGRGVHLDGLRLGQAGWEDVLATLAALEPAGITVAVMGPTIGDEWERTDAVPTLRAEHSPQACVGPDGALFTCPPLRDLTLGTVREVVARGGWADADANLRTTMADACPSCKYRSLCTGVDPGSTQTVTVPFREPAAAGVGVPVSIGPTLQRARR